MLAGCKSALNPAMVYSTSTSADRSKAVVPVLVILFVALWLCCVILFLYFSVLLALQLPGLGKRELILVLFICLFDLRLFGFVCFLFLLVSGKGCGLCNIWLATKNVLFSLLVYTIIIICGRVKKFVMPLFIFWIIFLLGLELNFIGKLLVFRWELIVLLLLQICLFFCYERFHEVSLTWKSGWHYWGFQFNFKMMIY